MRKYIIALICFSAFGTMSAQSFTNVSYSVGFPTGDLNDFVSKTSFRGFSVGYSKLVKPNVSLGLNVGWNVFYEEKNYDTYTQGNASLSGKQFRTNNSVPITGNVNYYFKPDQKTNPYVGVGIGAVYNRRNTDMHIYTLEEDAWNFTVQPEVGFDYKVDTDVVMNIAGKYYYCFEAGEIKFPTAYFALNIGFSFYHK